MRKTLFFCSALLFLMVLSCDKKESYLQRSVNLNDSIRQQYAPDKRVALFKIEFEERNNTLFVSGETDQPKALLALTTQLEKEGINYISSIVTLPESELGDTHWALVNNSVANLRSKPKHSGELATQTLLGMSMKILKQQGDFYLVQSPEGYLAWVDHGGIQRGDESMISNWNQAPKLMYTKSYGHVYVNEDSELEKVSDITLGGQLMIKGESTTNYEVQYPDGRKGYIRKNEALQLDQWLNEINPNGISLELQAKELLGVPYLWGGTSSKGMDCSGFTKTVFLMNGFVIPRDASQQIHAGEEIDKDLRFEGLEKGDLLFFGKKATDSTKQKVTHVGLWLGNDRGEFIHASGRVKIGSINEEHPDYDEFNKNRYLGSRKYLGVTDKAIVPIKAVEETPIKS